MAPQKIATKTTKKDGEKKPVARAGVAKRKPKKTQTLNSKLKEMYARERAAKV